MQPVSITRTAHDALTVFCTRVGATQKEIVGRAVDEMGIIAPDECRPGSGDRSQVWIADDVSALATRNAKASGIRKWAYLSYAVDCFCDLTKVEG
jgi:hypothetical protein